MSAIARTRLAGIGLLGILCGAGFGLAMRGAAASSPIPLTALTGKGDEVTLKAIKYDAMIKEIAAKKAKLTVVDAWATWCGPCKENFPHLVEMHKKYAAKGIEFASICLDDKAKPKKVAEATEFLVGVMANFSNYLLEESQEESFDRLDISAIPAVFMFGPDGKEVRRFTLEDVDNQFTYEQVEKAVQEFLAGKPMTTGVPPKQPGAKK